MSKSELTSVYGVVIGLGTGVTGLLNVITMFCLVSSSPTVFCIFLIANLLSLFFVFGVAFKLAGLSESNYMKALISYIALTAVCHIISVVFYTIFMYICIQ